jgi:hypothetical protein
MFPYESIQESADYSWTPKFIDAIASGECSESDLECINETLAHLNDWRAIAPLMELLLNTRLPERVRIAASDALVGLPTSETAAQRRQWWESGDPVLMRHTVCVGEGTEQDIFVSIAGDPEHPLFNDALAALQYYEYAEYMDILIKALSHPDETVRKTAAHGLIWDESWWAEEGLLKVAAEDSEDVACEALDTLAYYRSTRVLAGLAELIERGRSELKDAYESTFEWVREAIADSLERAEADERPYLLEYLGPVLHLLEAQGEEEEEDSECDCSSDESCSSTSSMSGSDSSSPSGSAREESASYTTAQSAIDVLEAGGFCEGRRYSLHREIKWQEFSEADRSIMVEYLANHESPTIRDFGVDAFFEWQMFDRLTACIDDLVFFVARSAFYKLKSLPRDESLAPRLWKLIESGRWSSSALSELFDSFLVHAPEDGLDDLMVDLFWNDTRDWVKLRAIRTLADRERFSILESFIPYLEREPLVTWSVHAELIAQLSYWQKSEAFLKLDLSRFKKVDDLSLQVILAQHWAALARG